jgi:hypothetical protein
MRSQGYSLLIERLDTRLTSPRLRTENPTRPTAWPMMKKTRLSSRYVPISLGIVFVGLLAFLWVRPSPWEPAAPLAAAVEEPSSSATPEQADDVRARSRKRTAQKHEPIEMHATAASPSCRGALSDVGIARVATAAASVYIDPERLHVPLITFPHGATVTVTKREGDWFLIRFDDARWGARVGFIHCSELARDGTATDLSDDAAPPSARIPSATPPSS